MKYEIFLPPRAKRQYERFDRHIRDEIESRLWELEDTASKILLGRQFNFFICRNVGCQNRKAITQGLTIYFSFTPVSV